MTRIRSITIILNHIKSVEKNHEYQHLKRASSLAILGNMLSATGLYHKRQVGQKIVIHTPQGHHKINITVSCHKKRKRVPIRSIFSQDKQQTTDSKIKSRNSQ